MLTMNVIIFAQGFTWSEKHNKYASWGCGGPSGMKKDRIFGRATESEENNNHRMRHQNKLSCQWTSVPGRNVCVEYLTIRKYPSERSVVNQ